MKTSKLIEMLQRNLAENGDLEIDIMADEMDEPGEFCTIATMMGSDDKPEKISLCGPNTADAFR